MKLVNDSTFIEHLLCQPCALEEWDEVLGNKEAHLCLQADPTQTTCFITLHLNPFRATDLVSGL